MPVVGNVSFVSSLQQTPSHYLIFLGVVILLLTVFRGWLMYYMRQTLIVFSRYVEFDLKNELFEKYTDQTLSFFRRNFTGDLMSRIAEDVGKVRMYVGPGIMYIANLIFMFAFIVYAMVKVSPKLTLYVLAPLPLLSIGIYLVSKRILKRSTKIQQKLSDLTVFTQEVFSGVRVLRAFNRQAGFRKQFENELETYYNLNMSLVKVDALFYPLTLLLIGFSTVLTIYLGGLEVIDGRLSAGTVAEFVIYVNMLTWPVASVGWVASLIQQAEASQIRINQFLLAKPDYEKDAGENFELKGNLEFKNVTFSYPDAKAPTLKNLNFNIKPGEHLGIVGKTGSGKTTVALLIARLFDPQQGEVIMDGKPLTAWNSGHLRRQMGMVPQEPFLFSDSIFNNIAMGARAHADDADLDRQIFESAKLAEIYEAIESFPDKFDTVVGERGVTLSGGQKQRVALARAFVGTPSLFLFDDTLSALDTDTEHRIIHNLREKTAGISTVIISHRVSSVQHCDQILVLDEGVLIDKGTHAELIERAGYYKNLYEKQQSGISLEEM